MNLKYLFLSDRQIVSLSPLHPPIASPLIGPLPPTASAPNGIAQGIFTDHLISLPDRVLHGELVAITPVRVVGMRRW